MKLIDRISLGRGCYISFAPETYSEGGGGFDDIDVTLSTLKFQTSEGTRYDKAGQKTAPLLIVRMIPDGRSEAEAFEQYFSCGDLEHWMPSLDGETLVPKSAKAKESGSINKNCNAAIFLSSLVIAGVPSTKLASEKISDLAGIKCHIIKSKRPKDNLKRDNGANEPMVLTVSRIISVPWGAVEQNVTTQHNSTAFGDPQLAEEVKKKLKEHGPLQKHQLSAMMLQAVPADAKTADGKPARPWAVQRVSEDDFLSNQAAWKYENGTAEVIPF